jgi:hypothetical protein
MWSISASDHIFHEILHDFHEILHRFSSKFIKIHQTIQNMFEIVPDIPIIILKQPPPPIVPLPHFPKAVKLGSEPQNREKAPKGSGFFELPATAPKQKSR